MMQAAFDPESGVQSSIDLESLNYNNILSLGFPFVAAKRVDVNQEGVDLWDELETTCVKDGVPVIFEGYHKHPKWDHEIFTFPYIEAKHGDNKIICRDLRAAEDIQITMREYVRTVHASSIEGPAAEQRSMRKYSKSQQKLLYAKDVTCPLDWRTFLMDTVLPPFLGYMGCNDLNNLNRKLAAENLMIYIGQEGTWTPAHIDQCGAIGHNIMTWADADSSSIWLMVSAEDKDKAEALWRSCGHPLEYESYFATISDLKRATFPIYVVEQKIGDLIMVPSLCYHQVVNLGKATVKVSWNRLTAHGLSAAVNKVLPRYREIARPEGYRIKTIIKSTVEAWKDLLKDESSVLSLPKEHFCQSFKTIMDLFRTIVEEDWVDLDVMKLEDVHFIKPRRLDGDTPPAVCDFCNSDLWNRHFRCLECKVDGDEYDVCTRCFSLGRGCKHRASSMEFVESFSMKSCQQLYSDAIEAWNHSRLVRECTGHQILPDPWTQGIEPSPDEDFSLASLAYKRQELLKVPAFVGDRMCHVCKSSTKSIARMDCAKCIDQFCEACLYKYFNIHWIDVASKRTDWFCPGCHGTCRCAQCDGKANIRHRPMVPRRRPRALMFSRPEEDARNRGGVADIFDQSFDSTGEEDEDMMSPSEEPPRRGRPRKYPKGTILSKGKKRKSDDSQAEDDSYQSSSALMSCDDQPSDAKRRKQKTPTASRSPTLGSILPPTLPMQTTMLPLIMSPPTTVRTPLSSPSTLSSPSSSISSSSLSSASQPARPQPANPQPSNQVTADRLREMMGIQEERAMRFAYENGLWRTIKTFQEEQEMSEQLRQIFEIDAFWAKRSQATRMSFQEDILEKFSPLFRSQQ